MPSLLKIPKLSGWRLPSLSRPAQIALALAGLLALMAVSWVALRPDRDFNERLHAVLQDQTQLSLAAYVEKNHPDVSNIAFHKISTKETGRRGQIKVSFQYSLVYDEGEDSGEILIDGSALLTQSESDPSRWKLHDFQAANSAVEFSEPLVIKAGGFQELSSEAEAPAAEPPAAGTPPEEAPAAEEASAAGSPEAEAPAAEPSEAETPATEPPPEESPAADSAKSPPEAKSTAAEEGG